VVAMYNKNILIGIFLSKANYTVSIQENKKFAIGYKVKPLISIRGDISFLEAIHRSLKQHAVDSTIKELESKNNPRPILVISGLININNIILLIPNLPDSGAKLEGFKHALKIINEGQHKQLKGLEALLEIKGVL